MVFLFNSPANNTAIDNNTPISTGHDNILPVVSQTQDDTGTQPVDNVSDGEDIPIASDRKGSEHYDVSK